MRILDTLPSSFSLDTTSTQDPRCCRDRKGRRMMCSAGLVPNDIIDC